MTYEFDDVKYSKYNKPSRTTQFVAILRNRRYLVTFAIATIVLVWYLQPFQSGSQQLSTQQQQQQLQNNKDPLKDYRPPPPVLDNRPDQEQVPLVPPPPLPLPPPPPPASISEQQQEDSSYFLFTQHPPPQKLQPDDAETAIRQKRIVEAFQHAWRGYAADAFGMDEYQPLSQTGRNWAPGGIGLMIVDALDTMLLMNLTEEYNQAREWVATRLDFDKQQDVNVFETTIRVLGGLLSAYHLSGEDPVYLEKAQDLGNRLVGAFNTESGIPYPSVTLSTGLPFKFHSTSSTAEATTIQLEFKYLSHLTGDYKYWDVAERVMHKMKQLVDDGETVDGLVPILMNPVTGLFVTQEIRLGSRGDSYYEYLIKQYLQTDKTEPLYRDMYDHSVQGIRKHLLARSFPNNLLYIGEIQHSRPDLLNPKMDHLVCFIGGTFALGATQGLKLADSPIMTQSHLDDLGMGRDITRTCYEMYNTTATGLASEIVYFSTKPDSQSDILIKPLDRHNLLRPETMESLFVLWRITGDPIYREWGWRIFEAFEKHTKLPVGGYAALKDVTRVPAPKEDRMDTFFLAETLKYLYLLFSPDDIIPLDNYVFNSEAHPLPIFRPNRQLKM